jgi:hypothetical protein
MKLEHDCIIRNASEQQSGEKNPLQLVLDTKHQNKAFLQMIQATNLFPFSNQIFVCITLVQAKLIQLLFYFLPSVIEIIYVTALLMRNAEDWPEGLTLPLPIMCIILGCNRKITLVPSCNRK